MKITVLGHGPVKRKDVTTALDAVAKDLRKETTLFLPGTKDEFSDAARFAADWAYDMNVPQVYLAQDPAALVELDLPDDGVGFAECADGDAARQCAEQIDDGIVLVAWDDAEVSEIEIWVKATGGKVLDLTNALAEITLEGEPDEAQQPCDERVVSGAEPTAVDVVVAFQEETGAIAAEILEAAVHGRVATTSPLAGRTREEELELIELGKAARTLLDYVVARVGGSY